MKEPVNATLRNRLVCALAELRFGNVGTAKKHIKGALMIMDDDLEQKFCNGIAVAPPDGEYKVYIDDLHILTKRIRNGQGSNHLPWLTRIPLLPWKGLIARYGLPTGDFEVIPDGKGIVVWLAYKDKHVVDKIRQVRGEENVWVGSYEYDQRHQFWFLMRKSN